MRLAAVLAPLVTAVAAAAFAMPAHAAVLDKNCADFATQQEAQEYFDAQGGSASNNVDDLDANGDGIACESLPSGATDPTTSTASPTSTPPVPVTTTPPAEETPTGTPAGTSTPQPPAVDVDSVLRLVTGFDCDNGFNAQVGRIYDRTLELSGRGASSEDVGRIYDALGAKLAEVNYCVGEAPDAPPVSVDTDVVVTDLDDNDSVATVSGDQVRDVPEGSIATGGV